MLAAPAVGGAGASGGVTCAVQRGSTGAFAPSELRPGQVSTSFPLAPLHAQGSNLCHHWRFRFGPCCRLEPSDEGIGVGPWVEEHLEGFVVLDSELIVFVNADPSEERLAAEAPVGVIAACVDIGAVGEHVEGFTEVGSSARRKCQWWPSD